MTFDPTDHTSLEAFLRNQIERGQERDKLDFKQAWLNSGTGTPEQRGTQKAKLELIKDINAMANTYSLEFQDYGFLILGVNRAEKRITTDVPNLRSPGVDNLEASIAQWLAEHMDPQPEFSLHAFLEPDVGTWGALIIKPNQSPPFVFKKNGTFQQPSGVTEQMWREGEWRLRRNAVTVPPQPRDYTEMLRTRIQSALEPLHQEVAELRRQVYRLEGRVEGLKQTSQAEIDVTLERSGQPVQAVIFTTARQAGARLLQEHRSEIAELHQKIATRVAGDTQHLKSQIKTSYGWYDFETSFDNHLQGPVTTHQHGWNLSELLPFMRDWNLDVPEGDRSFPLAGYYRPNRRDSREPNKILGVDAPRAEAYLRLLQLSRELKPTVVQAAREAPFLEFQLRFTNTSGIPAGSLRFELHCTKGGQLYRYAPGRTGSASVFGFSPYRDFPAQLGLIEASRTELLPGDVWLPPVFALQFGEVVETVTLDGKLWAANLQTPKAFRMEFEATPILD